MQLDYLDFDFSDEESGRGAFDAMASVLPARLPALLAEMKAVLHWATDTFGPPGATDDEGEWNYELAGLLEPATPLEVVYDRSRDELLVTPAAGDARTTLTLTLSGSPGFCAALRERFEVAE